MEHFCVGLSRRTDRPQQHDHIAPLHSLQLLAIPHRALLVTEFAQAQRNESRFLFHAREVENFSLRLPLVIIVVVGSGFDFRLLDNMEFHARLSVWIGFQPQLGMCCPAPKLQVSGLGIIHLAEHRAHQRTEEPVDEFEHRLATAEVVAEWQTAACVAAPFAFVVLENARVGQPKSVDALLDVTDEEAIRRRTFATEGGENSILCGVDVLVLVHENVFKLRLPTRGNLRTTQQLKRKLFEVGEVQSAQLAFGVAKFRRELGRQPEQRGQRTAHVLPVLRHRIAPVAR